jgi:hypothetical protein
LRTTSHRRRPGANLARAEDRVAHPHPAALVARGGWRKWPRAAKVLGSLGVEGPGVGWRSAICSQVLPMG